jgi:O-antigen ligase
MDIASLKSLLHDRERLEALLHNLHTGCAAFWLIGASGPMAITEFGGIPLGVCFVLRAVLTRRLWLAPLRTLLVALLGVWVVWQAVSLLWSPDPRHGFNEIEQIRWAWSIWMLYPVLDRRRILIAAYAAGFLLGESTQVFSYFAPGIIWNRPPDRYSGWWQPVAGGIILCSALGMHLPAAFIGQGRERLIGAAGVAVTAFGILLTGTRGAWLAAAALIGITGIFALVHLGRRSLKPAIAAAVVLVGGGAAAWFIAGASIQARVERAVTEVRSAIESKDYSSDTGARLLMNWWAIEAFARNPIVGFGAGGYHEWVIANLDVQGVEPDRIHDHAHCSALHIAATNGAIGLLITGAIAVVGLRQLWARGTSDTAGQAPPGTRRSAYDLGPFFAFLGLLLVSATNTIHTSAQPMAHLAILLALSTPPARAPRPQPPNAPEGAGA